MRGPKLPACGLPVKSFSEPSSKLATSNPSSGCEKLREKKLPPRFVTLPGRVSSSFGLPGAIAAKLAHPELPVVCLLGDGCFQMTCGELATALRQNLALPIVVLDDRWLSLIQIKQTRRQFGIYGTALDEVEVDAPPAHYFGVPVIAANTADELKNGLKTAFAASGPTVIEARVDPAHYMDTVFD